MNAPDPLAMYERELQRDLAAIPSPGFEARVLDAIDARRARAWRWPSLAWMSAAAAMVLVTAATLLVRNEDADREVPAPAINRAAAARTDAPASARPEEGRAASVVIPPASPGPGATRAASALRAERVEPLARGSRLKPEVLVPPQQIEAVRALVRAVAEGRVQVPPPADHLLAGAPAELAIDPIVLTPLGPAPERAVGGTYPDRGL